MRLIPSIFCSVVVLCPTLSMSRSVRAQVEPQTIIVKGFVTDSNGERKSGMKVMALPYGFNGRVAQTVTDANGSFRIATAATGKLQMIAYDETRGYPNTVGVLFTSQNDRFPIIEVGSGNTYDNVDIVLPPPDGIIIGKVREAGTGALVPQARITLRWAEEPNVMYASYLRDDGTFIFALPARPITVEIAADGFKRWRFKDSQNGAPYASLTPGSKTELSITMEREK